MQNGLCYIRDSQHFLEKTIGSVPENFIAGLNVLKEALEKRDMKMIPSEDLVKMAEFLLNNNIFDFSSKVYQQKSGKL